MAKKDTFESDIQKLEEAVDRLESGDLPLEDSLACFEAGVKSAANCRKHLEQVESRVELLLKDREGKLVTEEASD